MLDRTRLQQDHQATDFLLLLPSRTSPANSPLHFLPQRGSKQCDKTAERQDDPSKPGSMDTLVKELTPTSRARFRITRDQHSSKLFFELPEAYPYRSGFRRYWKGKLTSSLRNWGAESRWEFLRISLGPGEAIFGFTCKLQAEMGNWYYHGTLGALIIEWYLIKGVWEMEKA